MLSVAGADRLQTGMRGAFGKPAGKVAGVNVGQILISMRTVDRYRMTAVEALRRSMYKFSGRQKAVVSKMWGFTKLPREEYLRMKGDGLVSDDGAYVQFCRRKGELEDIVKSFPAAYVGAMA
jgi:large subunit ribosomal protein L10e